MIGKQETECPTASKQQEKRRTEMIGKQETECQTAPQVSRQVKLLEKAIVRMSDVCSTVEDRLDAILMPSGPSGQSYVGESGKEKPQTVPLAQDLERLTEQVNALANSMENMLARVEL